VTIDALTTSDTTPPLTGTVDDITASIQVVTGTDTVAAANNGDGTWTLADNTLAALTEGVHEIDVTATDSLNNAGVDTTSAELIIDTSAPMVTVDVLSTNDNTPELTGSIDDPTATII